MPFVVYMIDNLKSMCAEPTESVCLSPSNVKQMEEFKKILLTTIEAKIEYSDTHFLASMFCPILKDMSIIPLMKRTAIREDMIKCMKSNGVIDRIPIISQNSTQSSQPPIRKKTKMMALVILFFRN